MFVSQAEWDRTVEIMEELFAAVEKQADEYARAVGVADRIIDRTVRWQVRIDPDNGGLIIAGEYNDSCNCHPEYQTEIQYVSWDVARKMLVGEDWATPIQKKRMEQDAIRRQKEQAHRAAAQAAEAEATKQRELAELQRLQLKYLEGR